MRPRFHRGVEIGGEAHRLTQQAEAFAAQARRDQEVRVVLCGVAPSLARRPDRRRPRRRARSAVPLRRRRCGPSARPCLRNRDRNDAAPADQTHRRLQSDETVDRCWTDDAAVGFGADPDGCETCCNRRPGARARAARIAVENIWVMRLAAAAAPAADDGRSGSSPIRSGWFCRDDGAGVAKRSTRNASCSGRSSASASDPAELTMPAMSMLSFTSTECRAAAHGACRRGVRHRGVRRPPTHRD